MSDEQLKKTLDWMTKETRKVWGHGEYLFDASPDYVHFLLKCQLDDASSCKKYQGVEYEYCDILSIIIQWFDKLYQGGIKAYYCSQSDLDSLQNEPLPASLNDLLCYKLKQQTNGSFDNQQLARKYFNIFMIIVKWFEQSHDLDVLKSLLEFRLNDHHARQVAKISGRYWKKWQVDASLLAAVE